ncbi:MAG: two-component regulator propeller domain-containing protein [Pseudomonadota bacterium]
MQLNSKVIAAIALAICGIAVGACSKQDAETTAQDTQAGQAQGTSPAQMMAGGGEQLPAAGKIDPNATMPSNHPPIPQALVQQESSQQAVPAPAVAPAGAPPQEQAQREGKLQHVDPQAKFTHFRVGNRNVKSILLDQGVVWIGTSGGVVRYVPQKDEYKIFDNKSGLISNGVFYVGKLDNKITLGTYGGGMAQLEDYAAGKWKIYNIPEGLADAFVYGVLRVANDDIWIATWSGANRIRGGNLDDPSKWDTFTVENTNNGLPNDWVYGLAEGKNGEVWLATEGGLARFKDGKWQNWNHEKGLGAPYEKVKKDLAFKTDPAQFSSHHAKQKQEMGLQGVTGAYNPNYIISMVVDKDGVVWCGTWGGGLSRFDGSKWKTYTKSDGLPGNQVFMLHIDLKGKLWVGTDDGLAEFKNGKFISYNQEDGLFSNAIFSMASDPDGSYWVGSFGGVTHLRLDKKK